jgi:membrane-bound serine protease (ClpP class)
LRKWIWRWLGALLLFWAFFSLAAPNPPRIALLLNLKGAISPATQDFVARGLKQAALQHAEIVILQLDTPGGLDQAMRGIISDILASPIPVVTYVAPSGARAASAGTYILYASQIAAMAPGTNLGAASPVTIGYTATSEKNHQPSVEEKKMANDAAAYIRSLAQLRDRNPTWAEKAVTQAASLSAAEALQLGVIDLVADNTEILLNKIDHRNVIVLGQPRILNTTGLTITPFAADWRVKFLSIITDPNVAYILLIVGIWGLFFEFANPGFLLPGTVGVICLLLALYAFQLLPINYVGLGLILFGIAFMVAEAFLPTFGTLGIGGLVAFIMGSILLLDKTGGNYQIGLAVIFAVSIITAAFFLMVINLALKARFRPVVSGREELIGSTATIVISEKNYIRIHLRGEWWQVRSTMPLTQGQMVRVVGLEGLTLLVEPIEPIV